MIACLFVLVGTAAGVAEALWLERSTRHGMSLRPLDVPLRLLLVASALFASAAFGQLPAGVAGWATGFLVSGFVVTRRMS
jgi:hypothetical protein